jgi:hypothetical protein
MSSLYAIHCADGSYHASNGNQDHNWTDAAHGGRWWASEAVKFLDTHTNCGPHTVEEYRHLSRPLEPGEEFQIVQTYNEEWRKANPPKCDGNGRIVLRTHKFVANGITLGGDVLSDTECPGCPQCNPDG